MKGIQGWGWRCSLTQVQAPGHCQLTFFVRALGRVPKWGSDVLSTGLLMSEGTDSVLRSLATVWRGGNPLAGRDTTEMHPIPGSGRGQERALTWEEGYSAGGGFLRAPVVTFQPAKGESQHIRGAQNYPDDPDTTSVSPKLSTSVSFKMWGHPVCHSHCLLCPHKPLPCFLRGTFFTSKSSGKSDLKETFQRPPAAAGTLKLPRVSSFRHGPV